MAENSSDAGILSENLPRDLAFFFSSANLKKTLLEIFSKEEWGNYGKEAVKAIQGVPQEDDKKYKFLYFMKFFSQFTPGWWQ